MDPCSRPFGIIGTSLVAGGGFVDFISSSRRLREKSFGQSVTQGIIDTLPEGISRRSAVHRDQIDTIEHLGFADCVDHLCRSWSEPDRRPNPVVRIIPVGPVQIFEAGVSHL